MTGDQAAVIEFLASPSTHGGAAVERLDTHAAIVFLSGDRALKLKRAVRFDYLDFSTPERRRDLSDAEVRLNRRTAPALYRGVVAVTRERDGSLALGGEGTPVDWIVDMNRFDQDALFDRLAARGRLPLELMAPLAGAIARFHTVAAPRPDHGGADGMRWVVGGNQAGFDEYGGGFLDAAACARVTEDARRVVDRRAALLDARRAAGFVRQCHGDLHLRNIVLLDGEPTLFDAVEFHDEIACIDVLYDLAFLLMDLWRRQLPRHANAVWNAYLGETGDLDALPLVPLFLSCRAAVRAKTSATASHLQQNALRSGELQAQARGYLASAQAFLHPPAPSLIAVGGLSGSGKSTVAAALAPSAGAVPGAVVLRSDELRKRLCGAAPLDRLGPEAYTPEVSARVYATMVERAGRILRAGYGVIADAVYGRPDDRRAIEQAAAAAGVPFAGIWLDAPEATLIARVGARRADASDAEADVIRMQLIQATGSNDWRRVDASGPIDDVVRRAAALVQPYASASLMER